jgi:hypothetical protein
MQGLSVEFEGGKAHDMDSPIKEATPFAPDQAPSKTGSGLGGWLNLNVFAFGLTSMLGDVCHEMATAVLPQFMRTIGAGAATLGVIEGIADGLSSFVKLGAGFHSDEIGHRKAWTVAGYALTAVAKSIFAFALAWPLILFGRVLGWLGRGIRGPLRDAMLADSVDQPFRGKAFGFHRAGDTVGAVVGPLLAFWLLGVVNGVGDLVSSLTVGLLWTTFGAKWGFGYAVAVGLAGTLWMGGLRVAKR